MAAAIKDLSFPSLILIAMLSQESGIMSRKLHHLCLDHEVQPWGHSPKDAATQLKSRNKTGKNPIQRQ
jgi:hypothetical protein